MPSLSREYVRSVRCPKCGAEPGQGCPGADGWERISPHQERYDAAATSTPDDGDYLRQRFREGGILAPTSYLVLRPVAVRPRAGAAPGQPPPQRRVLSREEIRGVPCSECEAEPGEWCERPGGLRERNHQVRRQEAILELGDDTDYICQFLMTGGVLPPDMYVVRDSIHIAADSAARACRAAW